MPSPSRKHQLWVSDPRTPGSDACLGVYFTIDHPGSEPHGYGRDFDLGRGPEVTVIIVRTEADAPVGLTDDQYAAAEAEIVARFDFRQAARDERDEARELTVLEGVL